MELSDKQQKIRDLAISLLSPYDKEDVSNYTHYFERSEGDGYDSDRDTCDKDECVDKSKKNIRLDYGNFAPIIEVYYSNDGDHENIERCCICERPLNSSLTWISQEFEYYRDNFPSKKYLKDSRTAFDLKVIFESIPSIDERRDTDREKKLLNSVIKTANRVIKGLFPITKEQLDAGENIGGIFTIKGNIIPHVLKKSDIAYCDLIPNIFEAQYIDFDGTQHQWIKGFIINDYHAKTLEEAQKQVACYIQKNREHKITEKQYQKKLNKEYSFMDSINAGNCDIGTRGFILKSRLDGTKKYSGKLLLELGDRYNVRKYVEKMILAK